MPDSRARIWFALFVLAVFCLGGAGGFILGRRLPPRGLAALESARGIVRGGPGRMGGGPFGRGPAGAGGPGGPVGLPPAIAGRLENELQLDDVQRVQFRKVLDDHRAQFEQVHREARERFDAEQRELQAALRAILRPDQVQRFDQFISERRP